MDALTPLGMVIDRATAPQMAPTIAQLGGAWVDMFAAWRRSQYPYLALLAHTPERHRRRAPLTCMAADEEALRVGLTRMCNELSDVACRWALCIESGSLAEQIVRETLLRDAVPEGTS